MFKHRHQVIEQLAGISKALDLLDRRLELMETVIMVREPSSTAAADAYDGLRKQVVTAVSERFNHLAQLVQLDVALRHAADGNQMTKLVDSWFEQAALLRIEEPEDPRRDALFELVVDHGGPYQVLEPAYVDSLTNRVIRLGRARRLPLPAEDPLDIPARRHEEPLVADDYTSHGGTQ